MIPRLAPSNHRRIVLAALAALLLALAAPTLLWAYHLRAAGELIERGLAWPAPRHADALPAVSDQSALLAAEAHLAQARRWRPDHPHAYRLSGYVALAHADWQRAAELLDQARARAPRNPMIAWEAGLAYEQRWLASPADTALRDRMLAAWRAAGLADAIRARASEARAAGRLDEAAHWDRRAALMGT